MNVSRKKGSRPLDLDPLNRKKGRRKRDLDGQICISKSGKLQAPRVTDKKCEKCGH